MAVVAPGVDLEMFAPRPHNDSRARLGISPRAFVLLFVGRIQPLKAPDLVLRAAALMRGAERPVHVVVLGGPSGTDPDWLPGLAAQLGIADIVQFRPPVGREVLADYYRAADLTVVPSYNESFGLVALESQACGTPVVAAHVGGLSTAVADRVSGLLLDGHDPAVWAATLSGLRDNPARSRQLRANCRPHAQRFSWDRTTAELRDVYGDAMRSFADLREVANGIRADLREAANGIRADLREAANGIRADLREVVHD